MLALLPRTTTPLPRTLKTRIHSCQGIWKAVIRPSLPLSLPIPAATRPLYRDTFSSTALRALHVPSLQTFSTRILWPRNHLRFTLKQFYYRYKHCYRYGVYNHRYNYSTQTSFEMPKTAVTKSSASASGSTPTVSKKRKLENGETKYYAVRAGKVPGVYTEWNDCKENTFGFKGATYKSFFTRKDAEDFVAGKNPAGVSDAKDPEKFYGVAVGTVPGVYTEWTDCQLQIAHVKGPKYKKFGTRAEAEDFVRMNRKAPTEDQYLPITNKKMVSGSTSKVVVEDGSKAKKVKIGSSNSSSSSLAAAGKKSTKCWTDGSSRGNGKVGASAGVGVYFGINDSRNVSEPLQGTPQTNQRAELTAIVKALQITSKDGDVEIVTDSQYSINCATVWYKNWIANKWMKTDGGEVVNKDLVATIRALIDARDARGVETKFTWIKGHANDPGNNAADRLAVSGAMMKRG